MAHPIPPRYSPAELIAELREAAEEIAPELNGIRPEETLEGESAQTLEEMLDALRRIAGGAPNPQAIARTALDAKAPLRPFGKARKGAGKSVAGSAAKPAAVPERSAPGAPAKPAFGKASSGKASSGKTASGKTAFSKISPAKASPSKTSLSKPASGKTSRGKTSIEPPPGGTPPGKPYKPAR